MNSKDFNKKRAWNKGRLTSDLEKEKISIGMRHLFAWVKNPQIAKLLARDFAIANLCLKSKLEKPAIILYSGVLETMLIYRLDGKEETFEKLINLAYEHNFISESNKSKLHVIRDFRNYVHLYLEAKGDFKLTSGISQLAKETCESVTKGFNRSKV